MTKPVRNNVVIILLVLAALALGLGAYYFLNMRSFKEGFSSNPNVDKLISVLVEMKASQKLHENYGDQTSFAISYGTLHQYRISSLIKYIQDIKINPPKINWPVMTNTPDDIRPLLAALYTFKEMKNAGQTTADDAEFANTSETANTLATAIAFKVADAANKAEAGTTAESPCDMPGTNTFNACYYEGTNFDKFLLQRNDANPLDFSWGEGSPDPLVPNENFSASWVGNFDFDAATYVFAVTGDDGVQLLIDDKKVDLMYDGTMKDGWVDQPPTTYTYTVQFTKGTHKIKMLYYERGGGATAKLSWAKQ